MNYLKPLILFFITTTIVCCSNDDDDSNSSDNFINPNNFLAADEYKSLIVEIDYVNGLEPTQLALDNMVNFLSERLNKPEGIEVIKESIPSPERKISSLSDIRMTEKTHRNRFAGGSELVAYLLFIDGGYVEDTQSSNILGVAYGSTSMVIFEETIQDFSGGIGEPSQSTVETAVINHEFGHTLGLVNNGTALQSDHQDEEHGRHCDVTDCLMYYQIETSGFIANLLGGDIPELDSQCLADLKANGGK